MRVLNFTFNKISIEKKKDIPKPISINSDIQIKDVKKQELAVLEGQDVYLFEYDFKLTYEEYAEVLFNGYVIIMTEDSQLSKNIDELWKSKDLPKDLKLSLLNIVFAKCNLKALQLEEDVDIPQHLPSPYFSSQPVNSTEKSTEKSEKPQKSKK